MSRKKGLSEDEKKAKMKEFFIETVNSHSKIEIFFFCLKSFFKIDENFLFLQKDVFTLKQLEKEASKKKGFKEKEVKDIAQQCLDDNMIKSDKIGSSVYYWQFPSDETNSVNFQNLFLFLLFIYYEKHLIFNARDQLKK